MDTFTHTLVLQIRYFKTSYIKYDTRSIYLNSQLGTVHVRSTIYGNLSTWFDSALSNRIWRTVNKCIKLLLFCHRNVTYRVSKSVKNVSLPKYEKHCIERVISLAHRRYIHQSNRIIVKSLLHMEAGAHEGER